jgi:hypothetical protein
VVDSSYNLRILALAYSSLVAKGFCHQTLPAAEAKTHDELLADRAAVLKSTLDRQREHCQDEFQQHVLRIHP